jgi:hypothetical protein
MVPPENSGSFDCGGKAAFAQDDKQQLSVGSCRLPENADPSRAKARS